MKSKKCPDCRGYGKQMRWYVMPLPFIIILGAGILADIRGTITDMQLYLLVGVIVGISMWIFGTEVNHPSGRICVTCNGVGKVKA